MKNFHAKMSKETQEMLSLVRQKTGVHHPTDLLAIMVRVTAEAVHRAELQQFNEPVEQAPLPVIEGEDNV